MARKRKAFVSQRGPSWYVTWSETDTKRQRKKSFGSSKAQAQAFARELTQKLQREQREKDGTGSVFIAERLVKHMRGNCCCGGGPSVEEVADLIDCFAELVAQKISSSDSD